MSEFLPLPIITTSPIRTLFEAFFADLSNPGNMSFRVDANSFLADLGCCPGCIRIFSGRCSVEDVRSCFTASDLSNPALMDCISCLGVLKTLFDQDFLIEQIVNALQDFAFPEPGEKCTVGVAFPPSLVIRQHILFASVGSSFFHHVYDLKDFFQQIALVAIRRQVPDFSGDISSFIVQDAQFTINFDIALLTNDRADYHDAFLYEKLHLPYNHHHTKGKTESNENVAKRARGMDDPLGLSYQVPVSEDKRKHFQRGLGCPSGSQSSGPSIVAVKRCLSELNNYKLSLLFGNDYAKTLLTTLDARSPSVRFVGCHSGQSVICGRYCKWSRELSQTPWVIDGKLMRDDSLLSLMSEAVRQTVGHVDECRLSSAGREDIDVRMLSPGRPFILQLINARKMRTTECWPQQQLDVFCSNLENVSEGRVSLVDVHIPRDQAQAFQSLKLAECSKKKTYRCVVWSSSVLPNKDMLSANIQRFSAHSVVVHQRTPVRVMHRRAIVERSKKLHSLAILQRINDHFLICELESSAGMYIKEFVHGDMGRTSPCLADAVFENNTDVLNRMEILQLDVVNVHVEDVPEAAADSDSDRGE
eukprot:ANDGO_07161.mRNA.1 Putative tRNA pseudouridine synthase Pus10